MAEGDRHHGDRGETNKQLGLTLTCGGNSGHRLYRTGDNCYPRGSRASVRSPPPTRFRVVPLALLVFTKKNAGATVGAQRDCEPCDQRFFQTR